MAMTLISLLHSCVPDEEVSAFICANQSVWDSVHCGQCPDTNTGRHEGLRAQCADGDRWDTVRICTMRKSLRREKCETSSALPAAVRHCEHLQRGPRRWVRGGNDPGVWHAHDSLDQPVAEQHLQEAGAWQRSVRVDSTHTSTAGVPLAWLINTFGECVVLTSLLWFLTDPESHTSAQQHPGLETHWSLAVNTHRGQTWSVSHVIFEAVIVESLSKIAFF